MAVAQWARLGVYANIHVKGCMGAHAFDSLGVGEIERWADPRDLLAILCSQNVSSIFKALSLKKCRE